MPENPTTTPPPLSVRVDLTSQDLRTGTIRLPRQLHDHFAPGDLLAQEVENAAVHELQFLPPRELTGLQEFLERHDLRTNDAVIMHVAGQHLRLEPYYRSHRRGQAESVAQADPDSTGPADEPLDDHEATGNSDEAQFGPPGNESGAKDSDDTSEAPSPGEQLARDIIHEHGDGVEATPDTPRAPGAEQAALFEPADSALNGEPAEASADPSRTEVPAPVSSPSEAEAGEVGGTADTGDAFDSFAHFGSFEDSDFDSYGAIDELGELDAEDLDLLPTAPDANQPRPEQPATGSASEVRTEGPPQGTEPASASSFHTVQRRPFPLRPSGGPSTAVRTVADLPTRQDRFAKDSTTQQVATVAEPEVDTPEINGQAENPAAGHSSTARAVHDYLDGPNPPSILNVEELARQLDLPAGELSEVLSGMSGQPDSRLSSVRPGFYLLKRKQAG